MPCYDHRDSEDANVTMRFCCEVLSEYQAAGKPIPDYIKRWWREHQEWDASMGRPHTKETHVHGQ